MNNSRRIKVIILALLTLVLYFNTFTWLGEVYRTDPENSHGFLIPFIIGYLIWNKIKGGNLKETHHSSNSLGLVFIVVAVLLQIVSVRADIHITAIFSFIVLTTGVILYLLGKEFFKRLTFPIAYMFFLIPLPGLVQASLTFPMKLFASKVSSAVLRGLGLSVLREGNVINLPGYSFEVADACSGLRSIIALLALAALFAYFTQKTPAKRLVLFSLSIPIAIVANIFRVVVTCLVAYYVSQRIADGFLHEFSGILVFLAAVALLIVSSKILRFTRGPTRAAR